QAVADVVDAPGVEGAAAAHEAVDLVALLEEELREVAAILTGDPRDEGLASCHSTSEWAKGRLYTRVRSRPKPPEGKSRLKLKCRVGGRGRKGGQKGKGPQGVRPTPGVSMPTRPLGRMFPRPPTWLPPTPAGRFRWQRRCSEVRPPCDPYSARSLKQGPCHGGPGRSNA